MAVTPGVAEGKTVDPTLAAPTNVCGASGDDSVTISWDLDFNESVTGHIVEYRELGATAWDTGAEVSGVTSVSIPGTNGQSYEYRVAALGSDDTRSEWGSGCLLEWGGSEMYSSAPNRFPDRASTNPLRTSRVVDIDTGYNASCAVTESGEVACWGYGLSGNAYSVTVTPRLVEGDLEGLQVVDVEVGSSHACALTEDGQVACWGRNYQSQVGNGSSDIVARPDLIEHGDLADATVRSIVVGENLSCAVTTDDELVCWGYSSNSMFGGSSSEGITKSEPTRVNHGALAGLSVAKVVTSSHGQCVLTTDSDLYCWGQWEILAGAAPSYSGDPLRINAGASPLASKNITSVALSGSGGACVTADNGAAEEIYCWGSGSYGQLADGTSNSRTNPTLVTAPPPGEITALQMGQNFGCALQADGKVYCWGYNRDGLLGVGSESESVTSPSLVTTDLAFAGISVSQSLQRVCGFTDGGVAYCWGRSHDENPEMGSNEDDTAIPTEVPRGGTTDIDVELIRSGGHLGTCIITTDGELHCRSNDASAFTQITSGDLNGAEVVDVAVGSSHSCAITAPGDVVCWGSNGLGQVGQPIADDYMENTIDEPTKIDSGALESATAVAIDVSENHSCAITSLGRVACWGYNGSGQIGDGTTTTRSSPRLITGGDLGSAFVSDVTVRGSNTCVVAAQFDTSEVYCWGNNNSNILGSIDGAIGNGEATTPMLLTRGALANRDITAVTLGSNYMMYEVFVCALDADGKVICWGNNYEGVLGVETDDMGMGWTDGTPVAVAGGALADAVVSELVITSSGSVCALLVTERVACWGNNYSGVLADGSSTSSHVPRLIDSGRLTGGGVTNLAATYDGVIGTWNGTLAPGEVPVVPTDVVAAKGAGATALVEWTAPVREGAAPVTGYRIEQSSDGGTNWTIATTVEAQMSVTVDLPRDDFWTFRVIAISAAGESASSSPSAEIPVVTSSPISKSNVTVTFQTSDGQPVVGSSVSWESRDGSNTYSSVQPAVTSASGAATFPVIQTGRVSFTLEGGRLGSSATLLSSASVEGVVQRSGTAFTILIPQAPEIRTRVVQVQMPDGTPVPDTELQVTGGLSGSTSTGNEMYWGENTSRNFSASWTYEGWAFTDWYGWFDEEWQSGVPTTDYDGKITITGFWIGSNGADVLAEFEDGFIRQRSTASLANESVVLEFGQMPVVQIVTPELDEVDPGTAIDVQVVAVDGAGDPIVGSDVELQSLDGSTRSRLSELACGEQLQTATGSDGRATLTLCPTVSGRWRADGDSIVASVPITVRVKGSSLPGNNSSGGGSGFESIDGVRPLDTRAAGIDKQGATGAFGTPLRVNIGGLDDVPSDAAAVAVNITATAAEEWGFVAAYPCSSTSMTEYPGNSNLNFDAGMTVANSAIVPLDAGYMCLLTYGKSDVIVDVSGYFSAGFNPIDGVRPLDTRAAGIDKQGATGAFGTPLRVNIGALDDVPSDAAAVAVNITSTAAEEWGFVAAYPCSSTSMTEYPGNSNLNFDAGMTVANSAIVPLDAGYMCLLTYGKSDVIVDVSGYFSAGFNPIDGVRPLDTRAAGIDKQGATGAFGTPLRVNIGGLDDVPSDATAAAVNITATAAEEWGFVAAYPCSSTSMTEYPGNSNLNFDAGMTVANSAIVPLNAGYMCLLTYGKSDVIVDVAGYMN